MNTKDKLSSESWIARMSNKVKHGGGINLAQGIPGFNPPAELLQKLRDLSLKAVHQYPAGNGLPELVDQICQNYRSNRTISPDEVLVVQGATEGISLVYTYLIHKYGTDWTAMAFDPVYESYNELPKVFGNRLIKFPLIEEGLFDKEQVESALEKEKVKLVFINSPGNPYGKIWTKAEFEWILDLAGKFDFHILVDAVYKDIYFGESEPYLPVGMGGDRLFYINSFSKMLSITGWRVGYIITEEKQMKEIRAIHDYTGLCAPSILQYAISDYLKESNFGESYLSEIRKKLSLNYVFMKQQLIDMGFRVEPTGGGYFIWCKLPEQGGKGVDFSLKLYDAQKVAVVPGKHFSSAAEHWIRVNIAREKDELIEAAERIRNYLLS